MHRMANNLHFLHVLCDCKPGLRKTLLAKSSNDQIRTICDCILNMLLNKIELGKKTHEKLKKRKQFFRKIVFDKQLSLRKKKN